MRQGGASTGRAKAKITLGEVQPRGWEEGRNRGVRGPKRRRNRRRKGSQGAEPQGFHARDTQRLSLVDIPEEVSCRKSGKAHDFPEPLHPDDFSLFG